MPCFLKIIYMKLFLLQFILAGIMSRGNKQYNEILDFNFEYY